MFASETLEIFDLYLISFLFFFLSFLSSFFSFFLSFLSARFFSATASICLRSPGFTPAAKKIISLPALTRRLSTRRDEALEVEDGVFLDAEVELEPERELNATDRLDTEEEEGVYLLEAETEPETEPEGGMGTGAGP